MSAQLDTQPRLRLMTAGDLDTVEAIERSVYTHPWTRGNFADSLASGYHCWVMERRGLGSELLQFVLQLARDCAAVTIYLEVRASNQAGRGLYARHSFAEIGNRKGYYPAHDGREDAVTMEKKLA